MFGRFLYYSEVLVRLIPERDYALTLEALAEALPLEVAGTDARGRVVVWNAALAAVAGSREAAVGRGLLEAMPSLLNDPNVDWSRLLEDVLAGGDGQTLPRHPLGARVVRATLAPMRGPEHEVLGAVLCFEDITLGTREEEQRRFRARADAVAGLGAGIAHEIRNPLNALSLHLQLLREQLADPDVSREALLARTDTMIAEVGRMESLVQNLLEVSRGGPIQRHEERLDDVVHSVVERLAADLDRGRTRLELALASKRSIPMDRTSVERALTNIVANAVEAAGPGGTVWIATRDDPYSSVVVVDDNGPGIPSEARERVFELFWTSKRGGTGLGLPLARRAVERHGGELEVLERPGGGSRFVIHLPPEEGTTLGR